MVPRKPTALVGCHVAAEGPLLLVHKLHANVIARPEFGQLTWASTLPQIDVLVFVLGPNEAMLGCEVSLGQEVRQRNLADTS